MYLRFGSQWQGRSGLVGPTRKLVFCSSAAHHQELLWTKPCVASYEWGVNRAETPSISLCLYQKHIVSFLWPASHSAWKNRLMQHTALRLQPLQALPNKVRILDFSVAGQFLSCLSNLFIRDLKTLTHQQQPLHNLLLCSLFQLQLHLPFHQDRGSVCLLLKPLRYRTGVVA